MIKIEMNAVDGRYQPVRAANYSQWWLQPNLLKCHRSLTAMLILILKSRMSRNTAPRAPRWNIVKTWRRWCLGFNWISRKVSRKRRISEGEELTKGWNVQLPAVHAYSQSGARGVRGAVFRDIAQVPHPYIPERDCSTLGVLKSWHLGWRRFVRRHPTIKQTTKNTTMRPQTTPTEI